MCQTCNVLVQVSNASTKAKVIMAVWVAMISLRFDTRSAMTPAGNMKKSVGIVPAAEIAPSASFEPVIWYTSQPCAIDCIHVPISESTWPMNQRR